MTHDHAAKKYLQPDREPWWAWVAYLVSASIFVGMVLKAGGFI